MVYLFQKNVLNVFVYFYLESNQLDKNLAIQLFINDENFRPKSTKFDAFIQFYHIHLSITF